MRAPSRSWILVVDDWQGRLYEPRDAPGGRRRLDLRSMFEDMWEPRRDATPVPDDPERRRRFGALIADWLGERMRDHDVRRVDVLAPPRTLGDLRHAAGDLRGVEFHHADLGFLESGDLVRHPRVVALLER